MGWYVDCAANQAIQTNPTEGVYGCGDTTNEALKDWNEHLKERIKNPEVNDEVANYIIKEIE